MRRCIRAVRARAALSKITLKHMISFDKDGYRFHLRAGAVFMRDDNVLLHKAEGDSYWTLPGGRVNPGETAEEALHREMQEELKLPITIHRLVWVIENFFTYAGKEHHEVGMYFLAEPSSTMLEGEGPFFGQEGNQSLTFQWFKKDSPAFKAIEIRPDFLRPVLAKPIGSVEHLVCRDS